MKKKEMITYSGEELMQMELPPVRFVVKDFLSQGLNILAGQAKVGKSWMMLDLCIKVAKGEKFFGSPSRLDQIMFIFSSAAATSLSVRANTGPSILSSSIQTPRSIIHIHQNYYTHNSPYCQHKCTICPKFFSIAGINKKLV